MLLPSKAYINTYNAKPKQHKQQVANSKIVTVNSYTNRVDSTALKRVRDMHKSDSYAELVHSICNAKLMKKADECSTVEAEELAGKDFDEKIHYAIKLSLEETKEACPCSQECGSSG